MEQEKDNVESIADDSGIVVDFDDEDPPFCCTPLPVCLAMRVLDSSWIINPSRYPGHVRLALTHCEHDGFKKSH
jgi:hypothetical protein